MSAISTILTRLANTVALIRSAIYAIDVRDDIADAIEKCGEAIEQCYSDVSNPTLQTEALEAALQEKIDQGEMAALTIGDHTITAAKLANGVIPAADATLTTSGGYADAKKTGDELTAIKADLGDKVGIIPMTKNLVIWFNTDPVSLTPQVESGWSYAVLDCTEGDKFVINASGGSRPRAWGFIDSSNHILSVANAQTTVADLELTAPTNAAKLIINDSSGGLSYKVGNNLSSKVSYLSKDYSKLLDNVRHISLRSYFYGGKANFLGDSITVNAPDPNHSYLFGVKDVLGLATINNYGYSGSSLADNSLQQELGNSSFCDRYLSMSDDADLIIVFGGVNDVWHGSVMGTDGDTTKDTVWGALYVLCNGLINKYPTKTIVFVTPTKQDRTTGNMTCEDIAEAMKVMCKRYAIPVFDANSLSGIYPYNTDNADHYTRGDKLHLNAEGNARLGRMLGNFILSLFGTDSEKNTANGPFSYKEFDWVDGGYIRANGEIQENSDHEYSKPIDISKYAGLGTLMFFTKVTTAGCVFDSNNNQIGWIPATVLEETAYTVPDNAAYMILNYQKSYGKEGCSWMFIDGAPASATYPYNAYTWTTGGYYNSNGYASNNQYEYSEHINISAYAGRDIIVKSSEGWAGAFFDSNDTLLSALQMNPQNAENTFTVPSNAAYMILNASISRGYNSLYWKYTRA
jgi:lysophospholipase L1-like esterase